jgi:hypothetical protein
VRSEGGQPRDELRRTGWRCWLLPELVVALAMLLLVILFNPGLALFGHVLGGYDAFVYFYPLRSYIAETVGRGHLPLWNPYLFAGSPYLANTQTAVFYPGTWLFAILDVPRAYALNFLAHLWIGGMALYAFARVTLGSGRVGAVIGGAAFAFSGFMNGQAGHINQFSVAALLPAVCVLLDLSLRTARVWPCLGLVTGLTLQILAGHPQQVYMTGVALGVLLIWRVGLGDGSVRLSWTGRLRLLVRGGAILGLAAALAGGISAVQLLPTLELSRLSIRGGGLTYQQAVFDALPWELLLPAILPGYWAHLPTTEFFGHSGTVVFALAWLGLLAGAGRPALLGGVYVALGLVLAVGDDTSVFPFLFDWAPGFSSFRVPARWLLVSTFGVAILAVTGTDLVARWAAGRRHQDGFAAARSVAVGMGIWRGVLVGLVMPVALASLVAWGQPQSRWLLLVWGSLVGSTLLAAVIALLWPVARRPALVLIAVGALADLWLAGANLEHRQTIPNVAYMQQRDATDELLARAANRPGYRSLSVASTDYVIKETGEYEERYAHLPRLALDNLLYALKWNETLWPNVPLEHRLASADGYDGGVLPLRTYYQFSLAMLGERARPDGVLISRLDQLPEPRWLDMLGVRWGLAGRVKDDTRGVVYYDRGLTAVLRPGQTLALRELPRGGFTQLGMISSVGRAGSDQRAFVPGNDVAILRLTGSDAAVFELPLTVGRQTAPEEWTAEQAPGLERVERWGERGQTAPGDWIVEIKIPRMEIAALEVRNVSLDRVMKIRALNLIDDEREMAFPVTPDGTVERTEYFDVKLYERHTALPRAYLVGSARVLDDEAAVERLRAADFDPRRETVLASSATSTAVPGEEDQARGEVSLELDTPEHVRLTVVAAEPSILVLSDSWYPGWQATLNGQDVPIERANILFRAVAVPAGQHTVEFRFAPASVRRGLLLSVGSVVALVLVALVWDVWQRRAARPGPAA